MPLPLSSHLEVVAGALEVVVAATFASGVVVTVDSVDGVAVDEVEGTEEEEDFLVVLMSFQ